mgnify:CR=1 FL=1
MTQPKATGRASKSGAADGDASGWQDRRMIRGKWQDPEAAKKEPRADRTISIRLTEAEQVAAEAVTRITELEHELDVAQAELEVVTRAWREAEAAQRRHA